MIEIIYKKTMKRTKASIKAIRKIVFNLEKSQDIKNGWRFYN